MGKDTTIENFKRLLLVQLKRLVAFGKLFKVKGSYKLPSASKRAASAPIKKKIAKIVSSIQRYLLSLSLEAVKKALIPTFSFSGSEGVALGDPLALDGQLAGREVSGS
ncbi:histone H1.1-like [Olea europaea var. sylvestris]|uniref:histone H1.1-like n=1 Tax=Olea europaea var. sylvestris TaxID=158386 RepID=UPI000C1D22FD|nr:histone H1.1-like [Olea europaea var. sylvestris]